ncbi:hypothetical protein M426DRAFT_76749 [Hypoxylon sp. CI-4A]|nr:hypothetical protein M426DRAFT_76749 [Hypoxylon sp. CI-4A]
MHYGTPEANSLHQAKHYFTQHPEDVDKVVLSIKGAFGMATGPDGSPKKNQASVKEAVQVLNGTKKIDIFECARVDPKVPIETSINALADILQEGKIGGIGLSAATTWQAHAMHPITAVEIELSPFAPDLLHKTHVTNLTNNIQKLEDLPSDPVRFGLPRFQRDVFEPNLRLVRAVERSARGAVPIPRSTRRERVVENTRAARLTDGELEDLRAILDALLVGGARYSAAMDKLSNA